MFVLPMRIAPAFLRRCVIVDSYGGCQSPRIFEPQVVGIPMVVNRSLTATGTPASGPSGSPALRLASTSRARARASSAATCRNALTLSSTAAIRSRCASVTSTAETSPAAIAADSSAAVIVMSSSMSLFPSGFLGQDPRHLEALQLDLGRAAERLFRRQAGSRLVVAEHVGQAGRVRGRRNAFRRYFLHLRDRRDDLVELRGQVVELFVAEREPRQPGQVGHLVTGNGHAHNPRARRAVPVMITLAAAAPSSPRTGPGHRSAH